MIQSPVVRRPRLPGAVARGQQPHPVSRSPTSASERHPHEDSRVPRQGNLAKFGVPVPRGIPAFTVQEAVEAAQKLGGPVWVVKAQIHAGGRGKGGGVKVAKSIDDVKKLAGEILGMQLKTHQTGPEGQKVRRLLHRGRRRHQEGILRLRRDRPRHAEGGLHRLQRRRHGHRGSGALHAREDHHRVRRPAGRPDRRAGQGDRRRHRHAGRLHRAGRRHLQEALHVLHGDGRLAGRDQPAQPRQQGQHHGAGRQVQLRQQRAVPPSRDRRPARPRRRRRGRSRSQQVRPRLHQPGRQHRLPGERRRPGHGHHGHHQAVRRRAGQLPRRGRRRHPREGDRGLQDHAEEQERRRPSWSTSSAAS